jgi:hypothetical protein
VFIAIDITKERNIYFYPKLSAFVFANLPKLLANKFSGSPIADEFGPYMSFTNKSGESFKAVEKS